MSPGAPGAPTPRLLASGALAGLAGGLLAGLVALVVAWPALDAAVALEEAAAAAHAAAGVAGHAGGVVVSREVQRLGGLAGLAVVGAVLGAALAVTQAVAARRPAARSGAAVPVFRRCAHLGLAVLAAVVAVPQLVYPPLPPGAPPAGGDPLAALALGIGVVVAHALARSAARERGALGPVAETGLAAGAVLLALAGAWLLPDRTGPSPTVPGELLWDFRVGALGVQVVLVLATASLVGVFLDLAERRAARAATRSAPAGAPPAGPAPADRGRPR